MKKRTCMLSMILTIIFAFSTNGYSLSISINPFIDPTYSNSSTGTFNAFVTFTNNSPSTSYQYFQLQGETFLSFNSISAVSNSWNSVSSGGLIQLFAFPNYPALAPGQSFSFVMNYTLTTSAYNAGWGSSGLWSMNGAVVADPYTGWNSIQGFSTTVIPEPGTVILLGFGLLGLGFFARRRKKRLVI